MSESVPVPLRVAHDADGALAPGRIRMFRPFSRVARSMLVMPPRRHLIMRNRWILGAVAAASVVGVAGVARDAGACGGTFQQATQTGTVVTDHRMIFSLSPIQSTLYDEIKYSGSPTTFAWVLPIRAAVTVGLSSEAVFSSLESETAPLIIAPLSAPIATVREVAAVAPAARVRPATMRGSRSSVRRRLARTRPYSCNRPTRPLSPIGSRSTAT